MTAGHEYAGEIVELGANVTGLAGRRYCVGRGPHCVRPLSKLPRWPSAFVPEHQGVGVNRDGAFAEYVVNSGNQCLSA